MGTEADYHRELKLLASPVRIFIFIIIFFINFLSPSSHAETVRIGVYDNNPKIFYDDDNEEVRGIFADIIDYIKEQENWSVEYVRVSWNEGLQMLENKEIDLMPDVASSEIRKKIYDFNKIPVLSDWLQVYTRDQIDIQTIQDLQDKRIAVLRGSVQEEIMDNVLSQLDIHGEIISLPDYKKVIKSVENSSADVFIGNRFLLHANDFPGNIKPTSVIFRPVNIYFASLKNTNTNLLGIIDNHLIELKNKYPSPYYESLSRWIAEKPHEYIPRYLMWALIVMLFVLLVSSGSVFALKRAVNHRTEDLQKTNEQLKNALSDLKNANVEIARRERLHVFGQMASGLAHDFNNILTPIVGHSGLILIKPDYLNNKEKTFELFKVINNAAKDGSKLVNKMRELYKPGKDIDESSSIDLNDLLRDVLLLTQPIIKKAEAPISIHTDFKSIPHFLGIKSELVQVFLNLILNAIDAMPSGGTLSFSTVLNGDEIIITVQDTGIGMTPEVRDKCLQPFFTTKGNMGTGIGLPMVSNIIERHNGRLEIQSDVGKGTTFHIILPISRIKKGTA